MTLVDSHMNSVWRDATAGYQEEQEPICCGGQRFQGSVSCHKSWELTKYMQKQKHHYLKKEKREKRKKKSPSQVFQHKKALIALSSLQINHSQ